MVSRGASIYITKSMPEVAMPCEEIACWVLFVSDDGTICHPAQTFFLEYQCKPKHAKEHQRQIGYGETEETTLASTFINRTYVYSI